MTPHFCKKVVDHLAAKEKKNYLDYVPAKNPTYPWRHDEEGLVIVELPHTGFYNRVAQKIFKTPAKSDISLDRYGSFVWEQIDGRRSIYAISLLVKEQFGDEAEPLLDRLVKFFQILQSHKFITYEGGKA